MEHSTGEPGSPQELNWRERLWPQNFIGFNILNMWTFSNILFPQYFLLKLLI